VLSATNAEVGMELARDEQPSLILMDVGLPGMDGLAATALLKADDATRAIPVLALTELPTEIEEQRILAAGFDGYITKPVSYTDFLKTIAGQLGRA
jgi:two-component system cell cycle response regulator DivK